MGKTLNLVKKKVSIPLALGALVLVSPSVAQAGSHQTGAYDSSHLDQQAAALNTSFSITPENRGVPDFSRNCDDFFNKSYPWKAEIGDDQFYAGIGTDLQVIVNCQFLQSSITADAKAKFFGKNLDLSTVELVATASDQIVGATATLFVFGVEVDTIEKSSPGELKISGNPSFPVDLSDEKTTFIGPIPVTLNYGIVGNTGSEWLAQVGLMSSNLKAYPSASAVGYIEGGVTVFDVADLSVGGTVDIVVSELQSKAKVGTINIDNQPHLEASASVKHRFSALDGRLNGTVVLADAEVLNRDFFSWNGYEKKGTLLDIREVVAFPDAMTFPK